MDDEEIETNVDPFVKQLSEAWIGPKMSVKSLPIQGHYNSSLCAQYFEKAKFPTKTAISNFGEYKMLSMNQNRQLLLGGGQAAPGDAGIYLSSQEKADLHDCLAISSIDVLTEQEFITMYKRQFGKEPNLEKDARTQKKGEPCVAYLYDAASRTY